MQTGVDTPVVYTFGSYRAEDILLTESNFRFKYALVEVPFRCNILSIK